MHLAALAALAAPGARTALAQPTPSTPSVTPSVAPSGTAKISAEVTSDLDGDGVTETVSLDGTTLVVRRKGVATAVRLPGIPRLSSLHAVTLGSERLIAVEVATAEQRQLWVARVDGSAIVERFRLPLGPAGGDGEFSTGAELSARGLIRWQERPDLKRCDGATARLFAEAWDPQTTRWQPRGSSEIPTASDGVAGVTATTALTPGRSTDVFRARAVSTQRGAGRADELAIPSELDDGDSKTAWQTGAGNDGRGEFIGYQSRLAAGKALRLRIVPGDASSAAALRASNRPAKLWLIGKRQRYQVALPDPVDPATSSAPPRTYLITLPQPIEGCLSVLIESVYPGTGPMPRSLAISELAVETDLDRDSTAGTVALAAAVGRGGKEGDRSADILGRRGDDALQALLAELEHTTDLVTRRRLLRAITKLSDPEISASVTAALRDGWIGEPDTADAVAALLRVGDQEALAEIVASQRASTTARLGASAALATMRSARLLTLAGIGPRDVRKMVITGLSELPTATLLAAAAAATSASAAGDLWRAAVRSVARKTADERRRVSQDLAPRFAGAADYERRYRLATALAELAARDGDPARLTALLAQLRTVAEPESAALRQAVAEVTTRLASPALAEVVVSLLRDPDPGVRLAVVRRLGGLDGASPDQPGDGANWPPGATTKTDQWLAATLTGDRWPELRRAAAVALGRRCQRAEPARVLAAVVAADADVDVRQDALVALVSCNATGIAARLVALWNDDNAPFALRLRAVALAAMLGESRLASALVRSLTSWRSEAFSDEDAVRLAARAAESLGHLGGPLAAPALLDALDDGAYPEIVAAAATGLGALGASCPAPALAALRSLSRSEERSVALAARRAFSRCAPTAKVRDL